MSVLKPNQEEINPFLQLLLLLAYAVAGSILFSVLSLVIIFFAYDMTAVKEVISQQVSDQNINAFKILQSLSTPIGLMAVPALLLAIKEKQRIQLFYGLKRPQFFFMGLVLLIMIVSMPSMEGITALNQKMMLPNFLKGLEHWMKEKEDSLMELTLKLITVRNSWDFWINLVVIALLPAIGEELMFRGGIQRTLTRIFNNPHAAIWTSAVIFSAIHLQFYGFIPRMLLGAGFGYLYYFSGNIWYAMLAHFINNAYAVCMAFYMQKHHLPLDSAEDPIGFPWYGYLISAILTIALFKLFKDTTQRERKLG